MGRYSYVKLEPVTVSIPVLPVISFFMGFLLLAWVGWPILSFQLFYDNVSGLAISPLSEDLVKPASANEGPDYTRASNWLPTLKMGKTDSSVDSYTLSIPKLRINQALVKIGDENLNQHLIHFGGTSVPGKYGRAVVFGHSILPQFYDPKNYLSIFSLLPTLKEGDNLFVHYDGVDYRYEVIGKRVVPPTDVSGLEQMYDASYITLVTCVPPGTYINRLWVTARLRPFTDTP